MKEARNVEREGDHPKEFPLDPINHVVSNRCVRIPDDRTVLKYGGNR